MLPFIIPETQPEKKKKPNHTQNLQQGKLQLASGQQQKIILWLWQELQSQKKKKKNLIYAF